MERNEATHMLTLGEGEDREEIYLRETEYNVQLEDEYGEIVAELSYTGEWELDPSTGYWSDAHPVPWTIEELV